MAAKAETVQELTKRLGRRPDRLKTFKDIRAYTARIIRMMDREEISLEKGKSLVWSCAQLHRMAKDEQPSNTGNTYNTVLVAADASPVLALAHALVGGQSQRTIEGSVQNGSLVAVGGGDGQGGHGAPVAVPAVSGDPEQS